MAAGIWILLLEIIPKYILKGLKGILYNVFFISPCDSVKHNSTEQTGATYKPLLSLAPCFYGYQDGPTMPDLLCQESGLVPRL